MRAITLYQPWATLIAIGAKKYETRSFSIFYRGKLAIHAGKFKSRDHAKLLYSEPFKSILRAAEYTNFDALPFGCVIAIAEVTHVFDSSELKKRLLELGETQELAFGNYQPDRYCWWLQNVVQITPVPTQGKQGLWNWNREI